MHAEESTTLEKVPELLVERQGAVLWLRLNRPDALNALTPAMVEGISRALDVVDNDRAVRALVLTGSGKGFCAGADLKAVLAAGGNASPEQVFTGFLERAGTVFARLERVRVPTIAAVNGIALAGGTEILLCCDYVIAASGARIGEGHAKYAQLPGGGGSVRLPRRIGLARAKYLMFSGEVCEAQLALRWGLVDEVVSDEELEARATGTAAKFCDKSAVVLERMKRLVLDSCEQSLDAALRSEISMCALHLHSYDRNEGLAAFAEKRRPRYRHE